MPLQDPQVWLLDVGNQEFINSDNIVRISEMGGLAVCHFVGGTPDQRTLAISFEELIKRIDQQAVRYPNIKNVILIG